MMQKSSGGNYPAITLDELKKIEIPVPPIEIQQSITNRIFNIMENAKDLEKRANNAVKKIQEEIEAKLLGK